MARIPRTLLLSVLTACLWQTAVAAPISQPIEARTLEERALADILQNIECSASASAVVSGLGSALGVLNKINTTDATLTKDLASVKGFLTKANTVGQAIVGACNKAQTSAAAAAKTSAAAAAQKAATAAAQKAASGAAQKAASGGACRLFRQQVIRLPIRRCSLCRSH
ncbi:hypothetical protein GALMADRAFT_425613 [Galerina marginata CBS 339.88]|uniref:Uncharacterized protein n=1 Tax=Galerina marginata (strain CBS 339.88) TaxID=685588 RepID=A0A067T1N3_GALM3|nr:hypothetical protein GALMADRAFT_425613 [Galerina marginata CBS 339.88]